MIHTTTPNHINHNQNLTRVQITEAMAISQGLLVKKNAVVMDGLMPSGILVRLPNEREFTVLHLIEKIEKIEKGDSHVQTIEGALP